jgi:co-chaperonin GroES (HSP10)
VTHYTPLRGRVIIRPTGDSGGYEHEFKRIGLVMPDSAKFDPRRERNQNSLGRGIVIAMGPPMLTAKGVEVPPEFAVGDEILHVGQHVSRSYVWEDGEIVRACGQEEVCGVIDPDMVPASDGFVERMRKALCDTDPAPPEFGTEGMSE